MRPVRNPPPGRRQYATSTIFPHPFARSRGRRSLARTLARTDARSLSRSVAARSVARTLGRSVGRSVAPCLGWLAPSARAQPHGSHTFFESALPFVTLLLLLKYVEGLRARRAHAHRSHRCSFGSSCLLGELFVTLGHSTGRPHGAASAPLPDAGFQFMASCTPDADGRRSEEPRASRYWL